MRSTILRLSDRYRDAIQVTLFQKIPSALCCLLLLDGGRMAKLCGGAMLIFWTAAALIMASRPTSPLTARMMFIRWGFIPLFVLVVVVGQLS